MRPLSDTESKNRGFCADISGPRGRWFRSAPTTIYLSRLPGLPILQSEGEPKHCSKFVVVGRSESVKSGTDGSSALRCNCFRNRVESEVFRTGQKSGQVYESAALTAELRALREATLDFIMIWNNCEAAISNDGTLQALRYNRAHGFALRSLQCANGLQPKRTLLVRRTAPRSDAE